MPAPEYTGTGTGKTPKEKLSTIIQSINERFGTAFDAQDLVDGVTEQLVADEALQQSAKVNDKSNFAVPFQEALDDALVSRHEKHGDFINKLLQDEALGAFFRGAMLDAIYGRLTESGKRCQTYYPWQEHFRESGSGQRGPRPVGPLHGGRHRSDRGIDAEKSDLSAFPVAPLH